jgi:hypothetical protein
MSAQFVEFLLAGLVRGLCLLFVVLSSSFTEPTIDISLPLRAELTKWWRAPLVTEFRIGKPRYIPLPCRIAVRFAARQAAIPPIPPNQRRAGQHRYAFVPRLARPIPLTAAQVILVLNRAKSDLRRGTSHRLGKQGAKFRVDRRSGLGFVIDSPAVLCALQKTAFGEGFEFALKTRGRSLKMFCQLGQKPGFSRRE